VVDAELALAGDVPRDGEVGAAVLGQEPADPGQDGGAVAAAEGVEDEGAEDRVERSVGPLRTVVRVVRLPAEVVGVEPVAAAVVEHAAARQTARDDERGGAARPRPLAGGAERALGSVDACDGSVLSR
jgi:hypothetical protein